MVIYVKFNLQNFRLRLNSLLFYLFNLRAQNIQEDFGL